MQKSFTKFSFVDFYVFNHFFEILSGYLQKVGLKESPLLLYSVKLKTLQIKSQPAKAFSALYADVNSKIINYKHNL